MGADEDARLRLKLVRGFSMNVPHNKALGMKVVDMQPREALFELPYDEKLVGNPDTGVIHGGAITALLDGTSGAAVFAALTMAMPPSTVAASRYLEELVASGCGGASGCSISA